MTRKEKVLSGLAGAGFSLSLMLVFIGIIGVQLTSQANLQQMMSVAMTPGPGQPDPFSDAYDGVTSFCADHPDGSISQQLGEGGPTIALNCTDVAGLDLQGFREYFVGALAGTVWRGEASLAGLSGGDGEGGGLAGLLGLFTAQGNALFFGLVVLAILPLAGTGAAVFHLTPPERRLRRAGTSLAGDGVGGLVASFAVFTLLPSMLGETGGGDGPDIGAILDVFSGPVYATFAVVLVLGLLLVAAYLAQRYLAGRRHRGEAP